MPDRLDPARALRLAGVAARRYGVEERVEPLRSGANHVFRAGDLVIRVAAPSADVAGQAALARWLGSRGFRVPAPLGDAQVVDGATLSLWEHIDADARRAIDFAQLGQLVARLHQIPPALLDDVAALPFCGDAPWLAVEHHLSLAEQTHLIDAAGLAALREHCVALRGWQDRARQAGSVVCHGDLHPQNVLMSGDQVVIIDWDAICLAPPAWDHAALIPWAERWDGPPHTYTDFARGYGTDLRDSPLATELTTLRLLAATLNKITGAAHDPAYADEARVRIRYWLGEPAAPTWTPL